MINNNMRVNTLCIPFLLTMLFTTTLQIQSSLFALSTKQIDSNTYELNLAVTVPKNDFIYSENLTAHTDCPAVELSDWSSSLKPTTRYDRVFRSSKQIYQKPFTLTATAHLTKLPAEGDVNLHVSYYQHSKGTFAHELLTIPLKNEISPQNTGETLSVTNNASIALQQSEHASSSDTLKTSACKPKKSISSYIANLFKTTESLAMQLFLALILGLLLSLTPCIYPMIPITVGVLNAQRGGSFLRNFSLAISYTMGVSCTFALLGLFAAFTGQLFGNLMAKPLVIITIVIFLIYLAFAMMGFYEMHIPRFLQPTGPSIKGGSLTSAFLFGAASGTVASPCLSPGLLLLLTVVTTLNNYFLGFILLFTFGIGLSLPLLLIGTFSSSLAMLPRAGNWMVEIKRLFGLMMLATCLYFLKNIMSAQWLMIITTLTMLVMGIIEFYFATKTRKGWRLMHQLIGTGLIVSALFFATRVYFTTPQTTQAASINWLSDYEEAKQLALKTNKPLFIYLTAQFCSLCTAIERSILSHPTVTPLLSEFVLLKLNLDDECDEFTKTVRTTYQVIGVPTYLLIDPSSGTLLKRWTSKLLDKGPQSFAQSLSKWQK